MEERTPENPYSSANPKASAGGHIDGATWEEDRVIVDFQRIVEDYAIAEWFRLQRGQTAVGGCLKVLLFAVAGAIALLLVLSLSTGTIDVGILSVAVIYFIVVMFVVSKRGRIRMIRRALNRIVASDAHEYLSPIRVVFSQDGFDCASQWERRIRPWSAVERLISLGEYYVLVHGGIVTLVIPKRVFANTDEAERFLNWIRKYVPANAD